ncbi:PREDICTED: protein SLOW GREEN 1, chloroplastic-like [Nicotiana attenuata]|uniref:protein SLOW GREEN 1, chloroplastic-like n=1 Tax=Nicotiana attenuata TaxID=49451 RepID=UPI000905BCB8|nr:PREDICTED: protein SLOW GREEN 1, chloroplastic-like [Nicotiana attenuata]
MEIKIKNKKMLDAISIIDKLIEVQPNESEWPLMKSHLYVNIGEVGLAKVGFNEILKKDPSCVEAYHGLVMAASQDESIEDLKGIEKMIEEGMKLCKKENKKTDLRDFKLLLAQIRVIEGKYEDALKVYGELVKEEPRDFRPYLCQGIIYTLLRKSNEAEKCFEKYRRLVPQGHPYARYFDENMIATKVFAQKVENERDGSKS